MAAGVPEAASAANTTTRASIADEVDEAEVARPLEAPEPGARDADLPDAASLITVTKAADRLGPKVIAALEEKFNGRLVNVRLPDTHDLIF